jgi:hypothetical protein
VRLLVTIPHAFLAKGAGGYYGSEVSDRAARAEKLVRCVRALHHSFAPGQRVIGTVDTHANTGLLKLVVIVCTSGDQHLAGSLPPGLVLHHRTDIPPRMLGFECHRLLRGNLGRFDWFGYLEDDIELADPLFFQKLAWFNAQFGPTTLLQPNRYEVSDGPMSKLYVDGEMVDETITAAFQDIRVRPELRAEALGRHWVFRRMSNPHAGCFFADAAQMAKLAAHPDFATYQDAFYGPLESAASLVPMRCFEVYKPAPENAAFLEVCHLDNRILDRRVIYRREGTQWVKDVRRS